MTYMLYNFEEKIKFMEKIIAFYLNNKLSCDEIHFFLDLMLHDDILKSEIPEKHLDNIENLHFKMAFFEPDKSARDQVPGQYFDENDLKKLLKQFISKNNTK